MAGPLKQSETEAVLAGLFLGLARLPGLVWRWRWEAGALLVAYVALTGNPAAFAFGVLAVAWLALPLLEDAFTERGKQAGARS